jgi:hypothetical protein
MIKALCNNPRQKKDSSSVLKNRFSYEILKSVKNLSADWDLIAGDNFFLQRKYLSVLEINRPVNMDFRYVLISESFKAVAVAYFQIVEINGESLNTSSDKDDPSDCPINVKNNLKKLLKKSADKVSFNVLICGNSFISGEHGFAFSGIEPKDAYHQLNKIVEEINKLSKTDNKISVTLIKDFYNGGSSENLLKYKFHSFFVEPNMILSVNNSWENFDDYLSAMSSKYRKRAKSILKKSSRITAKKLDVRDISKYNKEIDSLYNAVHQKAKFRLASLSADYFITLKKDLSNNFTFTGYFFENKLVAFRTSFILDKYLEAHFIGLDYNLNKTHDLYQNILYDYVKEGLENRVKAIYFGRTASEIKSTVGAKGEDLVCYIKHRNSLSNSIIKPFIEFLQPSEWIPRNPFKDAEAEMKEKVAS